MGEKLDELNELFFDYISYLAFMARQLPWGYGSFALVKALEKVLKIQELSEEIGHDEFCDILKAELEAVRGTSSSDISTWEPFLDRLTTLFTQEMKSMQNT